MNRTDSQTSPFSSGHVDPQILEDFCNDKIVIQHTDDIDLTRDFLKALEQHDSTIRWADDSPVTSYTPNNMNLNILHIPICSKRLYHDGKGYIQEAYPRKQIIPITDAFITTDSPDINEILELLP